MKRILLAICGMAATSVLHAQIMPDSTVQICAYWTPGDKYAYNATEEKLKIDEKGDTMLVYRRSERRTFEVLAQTQERYQLRLSYSDYKSTDEQEQLIHDVIAAVTGAEIVEFTTSETGVLLGLTNLDALVEQAKAAVDPIVEATWKNMAPEERRLLSKKDFRKYLAHTLGDPSVLINAANDDLGRMFFFHGARLDTTRVYEMDEMFASILGGTDSLQGKTTFWISSSLTDSYSAVCCTYTEVEDAKKAVSSAVREAMQTVSGKKKLSQQLRDSISAGMDDLRMRRQQYSSEEVHLDSGWPLYLYFERTLSIDTESDKTVSTIIRRKLDIILDEEDESSNE